MVSFPHTQITKRTSCLQGTFLLFSGPVGAPRHSGEATQEIKAPFAQSHATRGALAKGDTQRSCHRKCGGALLTRQHSGNMTPHPDLSLMPISGPRSPHSKPVYGFLYAMTQTLRGKQLPVKTWTHSRAQSHPHSIAERPVTSKQKSQD